MYNPFPEKQKFGKITLHVCMFFILFAYKYVNASTCVYMSEHTMKIFILHSNKAMHCKLAGMSD